jgi:hypothetical protein
MRSRQCCQSWHEGKKSDGSCKEVYVKAWQSWLRCQRLIRSRQAWHGWQHQTWHQINVNAMKWMWSLKLSWHHAVLVKCRFNLNLLAGSVWWGLSSWYKRSLLKWRCEPTIFDQALSTLTGRWLTPSWSRCHPLIRCHQSWHDDHCQSWHEHHCWC